MIILKMISTCHDHRFPWLEAERLRLGLVPHVLDTFLWHAFNAIRVNQKF
jgi:hypothetical protein